MSGGGIGWGCMPPSSLGQGARLSSGSLATVLRITSCTSLHMQRSPLLPVTPNHDPVLPPREFSSPGTPRFIPHLQGAFGPRLKIQLPGAGTPPLPSPTPYPLPHSPAWVVLHLTPTHSRHSCSSHLATIKKAERGWRRTQLFQGNTSGVL